LRDNRSIRSLTPSSTPEARQLMERLSDSDSIHPLLSQSSPHRALLDRFSAAHPFDYIATPVFDNPTPLITRVSLSTPLCAICSGLRHYEQSLTHHTPDCVQYICMVCEVSQPGHFPVDCP
jgi:hypothetical protein